jgi:ribosome-associated heat shock protein Hsp15
LTGPTAKANPDAAPRLRLDKWLWQARFFKTRAEAAALITIGRVRVNGARQSKPGHGIAIQDVLTFPQGNSIRLIRIVALGIRRGPYSEAQTLYIDMDAAPTPLE